MDGNEFDNGPEAPRPVQQSPQDGHVHHPGAPATKEGMHGCLKAFLIVSAVGFVLAVLLVVGVLVAALFLGSEVEVGGDVAPVAVEPIDEQAPAPPTLPAPVTTLDGVTITWADSPSECDGNGKRLFSADFNNGTNETLELRIRILDATSFNFIHQSHVYTIPAGQESVVDLGGIPAGESIVQMIDEATDAPIDQTTVVFEGC